MANAVRRSEGRYTASIIRDLAMQGAWHIWIAVDESGEVIAVAGSHFVTYPTGLKAIVIRFGTGRQRRKWQHLMEELVAWGKSQGADFAEGNFRKGWRRVLPNWRHTHDSLQRVL